MNFHLKNILRDLTMYSVIFVSLYFVYKFGKI